MKWTYPTMIWSSSSSLLRSTNLLALKCVSVVHLHGLSIIFERDGGCYASCKCTIWYAPEKLKVFSLLSLGLDCGTFLESFRLLNTTSFACAPGWTLFWNIITIFYNFENKELLAIVNFSFYVEVFAGKKYWNGIFIDARENPKKKSFSQHTALPFSFFSTFAKENAETLCAVEL